mmetsp:Transcript_32738/g.52238  ORF Transcript_32738/g.52238 Transcript_32738/m.52238 type:complete len:115 (+) Transcript_32738:89-433(+)|eukprot:CAMPEP_0169128794 /NCGR_PEP_ID=MMETSP1015-20121227/36773_1 /TAXON_ID=342587 /ORGANISM="Karlodinium micrum, Strain CCMP2283" /LENGTH=114 /DNA_ID=CAMNT_0009192751 /DNA_START=83 /DNA_END=427 /DNA_ORIENTATION=+
MQLITVVLVFSASLCSRCAQAFLHEAGPVAPHPRDPTLEEAVEQTFDEWKPHTDNTITMLRGKLDTLESHVATLYDFGSYLPKSQKAVNEFYDTAVNATNRLQASIGLPPGPPP